MTGVRALIIALMTVAMLVSGCGRKGDWSLL